MEREKLKERKKKVYKEMCEIWTVICLSACDWQRINYTEYSNITDFMQNSIDLPVRLHLIFVEILYLV
jgi:hypothetical protein